jgi:hypothetical protein
MKATRTAKVMLLAVITIASLGLLASEFTAPPKARARRINTDHNIVTAPIAAPASTEPTTTPSAPEQR